MTPTQVIIGNHALDLKHLDKPFFPEAGLTKGDVVDYYQRIAEVMLPHLRDRPLNLLRAPDGVDGETFFQQSAPDYFPDWIVRTEIERIQGGQIPHVVCDRPATLVYLANQGCMTLHAWLSRTHALNHPDRMIFDLAPPDQDFGTVRHAARQLHRLLTEVGLKAFVQTTRSRGLHVVVPLDAQADFERTRTLAQDLASTLAHQYPERLTTAQYKEQRQGSLYLDTGRNAYGQTAVVPYAIRLHPYAPVATPLDWAELADAELHPQRYTIQNIFRRLGQKTDPWQDMDQVAGSVAEVRLHLKTQMD
jgi:bifunctional non-homologous end joining protein LigD